MVTSVVIVIVGISNHDNWDPYHVGNDHQNHGDDTKNNAHYVPGPG